ncbi:MAG: PqqD family protein [Candidatus Omnitrophica bacterium]|nr:PqqD family protein [Candidatus Omnitrophota bacterium]
MPTKVDINKVYKVSEDVVAREIQGEFIIIPITSGIGDLEDEIFTLNETGRAIWDKIDSQKSLKKVADSLSSEFDVSADEMEKDVLGLTEELLKRRMLVEVKRK